MDYLSQFQFNILGLNKDSYEFEFQLDSAFFEAVESPEVKDGNLKTTISLMRLAEGSFSFTFHTIGTVKVLCDRCLDEMDYPIDTQDSLILKLGSDYSEDDDVITIPEEEGVFDTASYIYQFIMLDIPIKHVHAPGKCNAEMMEQLKQHLAIRSNEEDDDMEMEDEEDAVADTNDDRPIDPRWSELLKIKNNKN